MSRTNALSPAEPDPEVRHLRTRVSPQQVVDLLQTLFAGEMVAPSRCMWIVSPWVSDVPILDNRAGGFETFEGDWPRTRVRLSALLSHLLRRGTQVVVATRHAPHNVEFLERLRRMSADDGRLIVHQTQALHEKGILADRFYLSGSMNLTHSGLSYNEEVLHLFTDAATIALTRQAFISRWGGSTGAAGAAGPSRALSDEGTV
jgi:hypothetical protein